MIKKTVSWQNHSDELRLRNLKVSCILGIHPHEQIKPQPVIVDLSIYLDCRQAARQNQLELSVDYAFMAEEIVFVLQQGRFRLLETAAEALCHVLLAPSVADRPRAPISGIKIQLSKPQALSNGEPSLKIRRHRSEMNHRFEDGACGEELVLFNNPVCRISRLTLAPGDPGSTIELAGAAQMGLMPLSPGLEMAGLNTEIPGQAYQLYQNQTARFSNPTQQPHSLLMVSIGSGSLCPAARSRQSLPANESTTHH